MSQRLPTRTATMRAAVCRRYGPPGVLRIEDIPRPQAGGGDLLVRVRVTAVTPPDLASRSAEPAVARLAFGLLRPRTPVLGGIVAGVVEQVGTEVTGFSAGQTVVADTGAAMGAHAEYACVPAAGAAAVPAGVSGEDAVAAVDGGLTALPFLRDHARLRRGQRILVNGASGAVGAAAVQLAADRGARVTAVCSGGNADLVAALGAAEVIDYTGRDFTDAGRRFDVVFDAVGTSTYPRCRRLLVPGGVYLTTEPGPAILAQSAWTALFGRTTARLALTGLRPAPAKAADIAELTRLVREGRITPVVDGRYPLDRIRQAHERVATRRKRGSVIVAI